MANKKCLIGAVFVLIGALVLAGCKGEIDVSGTWKGSIEGLDVTLTITKIGWTLSAPGFTDTGTFMRDGNAGRFTSDNNGRTIGTAEILDRKSMSITLNSNSIAPGTYLLLRNGNIKNEKTDKKLNGTWIRGKEEWTFNNGELIQIGGIYGDHEVKGAYTTVNGKIAKKITHIRSRDTQEWGLFTNTDYTEEKYKIKGNTLIMFRASSNKVGEWREVEYKKK